jgi:hypothetical protein
MFLLLVILQTLPLPLRQQDQVVHRVFLDHKVHRVLPLLDRKDHKVLLDQQDHLADLRDHKVLLDRKDHKDQVVHRVCLDLKVSLDLKDHKVYKDQWDFSDPKDPKDHWVHLVH